MKIPQEIALVISYIHVVLTNAKEAKYYEKGWKDIPLEWIEEAFEIYRAEVRV